jgi:hypothetical protein
MQSKKMQKWGVAKAKKIRWCVAGKKKLFILAPESCLCIQKGNF